MIQADSGGWERPMRTLPNVGVAIFCSTRTGDKRLDHRARNASPFCCRNKRHFQDFNDTFGSPHGRNVHRLGIISCGEIERDTGKIQFLPQGSSFWCLSRVVSKQVLIAMSLACQPMIDDAPAPTPVHKGVTLWDLDPLDSAILKALAIAGIVLHNFFHAVSPVHQNEFTFDPARWAVFLQTVRQPALAIQAFFSFFGHFGVQIFVFLSAYGLAKSHWNDPLPWTDFMAGRVRKLYPAFGLVVLPWIIVMCFHLGPLVFLQKMGLDVGSMLVGLSPFLPGHGLAPIGPWWFIPFILQFYAVFPLLRKLTKRFGWPGLLVLTLVGIGVTAIADPVLAHWSMNLRETPFGRLPTICFGILAARYPIRIPASTGIAGGLVLLVGSASAAVWPFTGVGALILSLWIYTGARGTLRRFSVLERIGQYSIVIFTLNGIVRDEFVGFTGSPASQLVYGALSAAVTLAISALLYEFVLRRPANSPRSVGATGESSSLRFDSRIARQESGAAIQEPRRPFSRASGREMIPE